MKIWLIKANEPMPVIQPNERLFRMGMIADELNKRGHTITWFGTTFDHFKKKQIYNKDTIVNINENYKINLAHAPGYKKNISVMRIINHKIISMKFRKVANEMEKPDIIYVAFPTINYAEEAVRYGKKNNVPVIVDIRDLWPDIFNHNLKGIKRIIAKPYIKLMDYKTKKIMRNAYAINSISNAMLNWGLQKGNREKEEKDRYFYIGYSRPKDIKYKKCNGIDEKKFNISFLGTINNQFDYEKINQIAEELEKRDTNIVINICGDGPQFKDLKEKVENRKNVQLFGWIGKDEINYILNISKLGFAPYKNTFDFKMSISNKFAEYISTGLPVILTSEGHMKEIIEKYNCGFSSQDTKKICDFIVDIKNNKEKYERISMNASKLYEEKFVSEDIYKDLVDYLEKIKEDSQNEVCTNRVWQNIT